MSTEEEAAPITSTLTLTLTLTPSLIKGLASCNSSIRSKSLKSLFNWLPSQTLISDDDFKRLWKALFYCMWHCDKVQNQSHLINRLSLLLSSLPSPLSLSYFSHFLAAMRREWPGIDHLRLDKFYLLVRHFVRNLFVLLKNSSWDLSVLEDFVRVLEIKAFFFVDDDGNGDNGLGNGVTYHIVSVFCDEIKPFLPLKSEVLNLLFRPFFGVLSKSDNKVFIAKVKSHVFDFLIKSGKRFLEVKKSAESEVDEKDNEAVLFGTIALAMGFSTRLYELGSNPDCIQGNRKVVFGLHEEFLKLEKEKAALGVEVSLPQVDDEVPQLVPINGEAHGSKKSKKMNGVLEAEQGSKKIGESKKALKEKKSRKKKKKKSGVTDNSGSSGNDTNSDTEMVNVSDSTNAELDDGVNAVELDEDLISNLQKQFEKIADESGLVGDGVSVLDSPATTKSNSKSAKKRKRSKSVANADTYGLDDAEKEEALLATEDKSGKRVRFAMKNNIVWKPDNPLPPQSMRIPPSSTPRGSALKKGLSPGPIRDTALEVKRARKRKPSPLKKARKVKSISPAVKRGKKKKVKPMSA